MLDFDANIVSYGFNKILADVENETIQLYFIGLV